MGAPPWAERVRRLVQRVVASDVVEMEVRTRGFRLRLRRAEAGAVVANPSTPVPTAPVQPTLEQDLHEVRAPLTGVFYRAPSPGAPPFVGEGEWVEEGAVVGLIETMKVFTEVHADRSGVVVRFVIPSGHLVHVGDPLLTLDVGASRPQDREGAGPRAVP